MNKNCNYLQSIMGIFVHSANIPQRVVKVLAHAGLSISIKSIQRAVKSMSMESAYRIKEGLRSLKVGIAYDNFNINFKNLRTNTHSPIDVCERYIRYSNSACQCRRYECFAVF